MTEVERTVEFEAAPDEVWDALVDDALLSEWFDGDVELDLRPGGTLRVGTDHGVREALVEDVERDRRLSFTWPGDVDRPPSTVELVLEPSDDGCTLHVRESLVEAPAPVPFPIGFQPPAPGGAALALAR
jgi:uncharacterized protein YndB with AHSA1/START domain